MTGGQEVSVVVDLPLESVRERLRDVEAWSSFLLDVEQVTKVSWERYDFRIVEGGRRDRPITARVAVHEHPRRGTYQWTSLNGPHFTGSLHLSAAGDDATRVRLVVSRWPSGPVATVVESVMPRSVGPAADGRWLEAFLLSGRDSAPA